MRSGQYWRSTYKRCATASWNSTRRVRVDRTGLRLAAGHAAPPARLVPPGPLDGRGGLTRPVRVLVLPLGDSRPDCREPSVCPGPGPGARPARRRRAGLSVAVLVQRLVPVHGGRDRPPPRRDAPGGVRDLYQDPGTAA